MRLIFDWAEAWVVLIPLSTLLIFRPDKKKIQPVQFYFILAFVLNILIDISWKFKDEVPDWAKDNNILYNTQSVARVVLFTIFFVRFLSGKYKLVFKWSLIAYATALLFNFIFLESPLRFSSRIFSAEALFLLTICILYFFSLLNDDQIFSYRKQPAFWIAIGLSLYEASNFSIFLFYSILISKASLFAVFIWDFHNLFYTILCIFSARAFYECRRK